MGTTVDAGRSQPPRAELKWIDMRADETPAHPTVVDDIYARRLDGVTISGVFTPEQCERASALMDTYAGETTPAMFGTMLGMSLANLGALNGGADDRTIYLDETEHARARYREAFGMDPRDRIAEVVEPLTGGRLRVTAPEEDGRSYNFGNIRRYEIGSGGLPAHAGNEFEMHEAGVTRHLCSTTRTRDHLSWFVVLQAPDEGGALSVFDLLYESHRANDPQWGELGRNDADFDSMPAKKIAPEPGGMILFGGGWRWHRVDKIRGTVPRITYGGFAGPSLDGTSLNFWF